MMNKIYAALIGVIVIATIYKITTHKLLPCSQELENIMNREG